MLMLRILNSQAVWLKKANDAGTAIQTLQKAQRLIYEYKLTEKGTTSLNICTIMSYQNKHSKALEYAHKAIIQLTMELGTCKRRDFPEKST